MICALDFKPSAAPEIGSGPLDKLGAGPGTPCGRRAAAAPPRVLLALLLLVLVAAGCRRQEITVYTVPKEKAAPPMAARRPDLPRARPQVSWTLPNGWKETGPGQMSIASFSIPDPAGAEAQVTITQLMQLGERDAEIVNMFRDQLGLDPLSREEVERQLEAVPVGGESGKLFQLEGTPRKATNVVRIVTALVHRADASWFYKLAGDPPLVQTQKPAFIAFLGSIRIQEADPQRSELTESTAPVTKPNWRVPAHWVEVPAGEMQVAKFAVPKRGSAKAEVSVSLFPTDTGGTLANLNRWRVQLGLAEVPETQLQTFVSALDPANPGAKLVDLANNNRRLLGAIVPRGGNYWFYKLLGDSEAVAPEKDAFVRFAQSTP